AASNRELSRRTGVPIDADEVATRVGPQLELELARWFPPADVPAIADTYREIFAVHGVPATTVLSGAAAALAEVRRQGGRSAVVTAKSEPLARAALDRALAALGSVVVAFSGGADSAFVLAAAVHALGPGNVVAATAVSPSLPAHELAAAAEFAAALGVRHETPRTDEMARPGYR